MALNYSFSKEDYFYSKSQKKRAILNFVPLWEQFTYSILSAEETYFRENCPAMQRLI